MKVGVRDVLAPGPAGIPPDVVAIRRKFPIKQLLRFLQQILCCLPLLGREVEYRPAMGCRDDYPGAFQHFLRHRQESAKVIFQYDFLPFHQGKVAERTVSAAH